MKILISAAEASSDLHGAHLLRALRTQLDSKETLEAFGIGGPQLQSAGLQIQVDARELLVMGFVEVVVHVPRILGALRRITQAAQKEKPDVAVLIDYPDFHFALAKRLKKLGIPTIYYIPPKVWVWRKRRVKVLKKFFSKILCIFPFEEAFYQSYGIPVKYIGNPLLDSLQINELPTGELPISLTKVKARNKLGFSQSDRILVLMPGSRPSELKQHFILLLETALLTSKKLQDLGILVAQQTLKVLVPLPQTADQKTLKLKATTWLSQNQSKEHPRIHLFISQNNSADCLLAADFGLIKSGTSTLEAGLLKCPHIVLFKAHPITSWIYKYLIRHRGPIGLVNWIVGWKKDQDFLVPELINEQVTPETLSTAAIEFMSHPEKCQKMIQGFDILISKLRHERHKSPSSRAAAEIIAEVQSRNA
jgi:lipid-A-disaccharide synthase